MVNGEKWVLDPILIPESINEEDNYAQLLIWNKVGAWTSGKTTTKIIQLRINKMKEEDNHDSW